MKEFIKGQKYTEEEYILLSIDEMGKSISEHTHKADPKVGAVLVDANGAYFDKAHRGELRKGDHGEFTLIERKHPGKDLTNFTLYTTLEPCVKRNAPKRGCSFRTINARIGEVVIGHADPDPSVASNGVKLLQKAGIEVTFYDRKYEKIIAKENKQFFKEASERAEREKTNEINYAIDPIENELIDFQLNDLSEEAQKTMIDRMDLPFKLGSDAFKSYLNKMNLIKIDEEAQTAKPTGLGLLLLGQDPQYHFPQARIKFTVRSENNEPIIKDFEGPLVLLPEKIEEYLEFVFPKGFSRSSFERTEIIDESSASLLEVIMNAMVHRDYSIDGARIMIDIDDEKIIVSSPGKPLCPIEKLNNFTAPSFSRNAKIAHIFFQMGFVEERGFGLEELAKMEQQGYKRPVFNLDDDILKTTLYRIRNKDVQEKETLNTNFPGLDILREHKRLSTKQYKEIADVSERQSRRHLKKLLEMDLAEKDGTYYVLKE
jgi:ATP-dependent DNA helicase RecG